MAKINLMNYNPVNSYFSLLLLFVLSSFGSVQSQTADNLPLRLRVGTYNIGHFNQGRLGGFQWTGKNTVTAELNNWRKWIGEQGLDILGVNEWNRYFDKDSTFDATAELLAPYYSKVYLGEENTWIYNGIATNYTLNNIRQINSYGDYYAILGDLKIGDKVITIISTHLPWQKEWHDDSVADLIKLLGDLDYFICLGDMNANDANQQLFVEAGFNMANGGDMGWFQTAAAKSAASGYAGKADVNIDNIITSSNIRIMNVRVPKTGLNDLDHLPVLADVIVVWE